MSLTFCTIFFFLENIFTQQPSYYSDLEKTVPTVLQVKSAFHTLEATSGRMYLCRLKYIPILIILLRLQVFDTILEKCGLRCEGATAMEPMKLSTEKQLTPLTMSQQVR